MKLRMIASAVLLVIGSAALSTNADAAPWRGGRGGCYVPHPVVRICAPVQVFAPPCAPVVTGGYYGGGYSRPSYNHGYAYGYRGGNRGYERGCYRGRR